MTTAYTSLLGLALPVTGELNGTWGDVVNNSITNLLDSAIAGTTTLSTDADVTLTTTTGSANQSREAILLWTANGTTTRNITAPAQSKIYTVINASAGTQSIVLRGVGPTTGVTILKGESALCAWNGSDFIKISNTAGAATFTDVTISGSETLSGGTANGVAYLNGSKVVTTGTALVFDGTNFGVGTTSPSTFGVLAVKKDQTSDTAITVSNAGTSNAATTMSFVLSEGGTKQGWFRRYRDGSGNTEIGFTESLLFTGDVDATKVQHAIIDNSGNFGLGVTPSAWGSSWRVLEGSFGQSWFYSNTNTITGLVSNTYHNGTNWIYKTTNAAARYQLGTSNGDHEWYTSGSGTAGNAISFTQAMTLDSNGKLMIGPGPNNGQTYRLGVYKAASDVQLLLNSDNGYNAYINFAGYGGGISYGRDGATGYFRWNSSVDLSGTQVMTLDTSGNFMVGPTSPTATPNGLSYGFLTNKRVLVGNGASAGGTTYTGGGFVSTAPWDGSASSTHNIALSDVYQADNSAGLVVFTASNKGNPGKIGTLVCAFYKQRGAGGFITTISTFKSSNLTTLSVIADSTYFTVSTDSDCQVTYSVIAAA